MPIYEYCCPACKKNFELIRSRSAANLGAPCPDCEASADRVISGFSHFAATPSSSPLQTRDKANEKMWLSKRKSEDWAKKNPDPLKKWRDEREKSCGKGPEAWVEYSNQEKAKDQKKKDYGEGWMGREV